MAAAGLRLQGKTCAALRKNAMLLRQIPSVSPLKPTKLGATSANLCTCMHSHSHPLRSCILILIRFDLSALKGLSSKLLLVTPDNDVGTSLNAASVVDVPFHFLKG